MTDTGRGVLAGVLTALACLAMPVTLASEYAAQVLGSPGGFSGRAVTVVESSGVDSLVVGAVTNRVMALTGGQSGVQPIVQEAVRTALASPQVIASVQNAAASLQRELVAGSASTLTLTLPGIGSSAAPVVAATSPALAAALRNLGPVTVVSIRVPHTYAKLAHGLGNVARESSPLLVLTGALILSALLLSPRRARTLRVLGLGALLCGLLAIGVAGVGRGLAVNAFSAASARLVAGVMWSTYLGGLEAWGLVMAGAGAGVTGVGVLAGL
ncbi:MAG: hypothetical protein M0T77_11730 [Actinomycetota bacterium]|nr:hypothetical protein [Actinomycetota bacterium]